MVPGVCWVDPLHAGNVQSREAHKYQRARTVRSATYSFVKERLYPRIDHGGSAVARHTSYTSRQDTTRRARTDLGAWGTPARDSLEKRTASIAPYRALCAKCLR